MKCLRKHPGTASLRGHRYDQNLCVTYFELFENTEEAIPFLVNNGTKFNRYANQHLSPLAFILCLGKKEASQAFFLNYLEGAGGKGQILKLHKELAGGKQINLMYSVL